MHPIAKMSQYVSGVSVCGGFAGLGGNARFPILGEMRALAPLYRLSGNTRSHHIGSSAPNSLAGVCFRWFRWAEVLSHIRRPKRPKETTEHRRATKQLGEETPMRFGNASPLAQYGVKTRISANGASVLFGGFVVIESHWANFYAGCLFAGGFVGPRSD